MMFNRMRRTTVAAASALALAGGAAAWAASSASVAGAADAAHATVAAAAAPAALLPVCTSADLAVWVDYDALSGAAGTWYFPLEFTNITGQTCRTWGWPGVSATNASGTQLGDAALRSTVYTPQWVNIPPGGTAHALFGYGAAELSISGCKPQDAAVIKVYAPDQYAAGHGFFDLPSCSVGGHTYLTVSAIEPGPNI